MRSRFDYVITSNGASEKKKEMKNCALRLSREWKFQSVNFTCRIMWTAKKTYTREGVDQAEGLETKSPDRRGS